MIERSPVQFPAVTLSGNNSGQVVHTHVPLSPSSVILYRPKRREDNSSMWERCGLPPTQLSGVCSSLPAQGHVNTDEHRPYGHRAVREWCSLWEPYVTFCTILIMNTDVGYSRCVNFYGFRSVAVLFEFICRKTLTSTVQEVEVWRDRVGCRGLKVVKSCSKDGISHFLLTCSDTFAVACIT